jgi:hypothetical protein
LLFNLKEYCRTMRKKGFPNRYETTVTIHVHG